MSSASRSTSRSRVEQSEAAVVGPFGHLLAALRHAHSRGFVHCDVKPENVRLSVNCDRAVVVDWGLARQRSKQRPHIAEVSAYASPEQLTGVNTDEIGRPKLQPAADVWSLGATLYEMLVGRPPFGDGTGGDCNSDTFDALVERVLRLCSDLPARPLGRPSMAERTRCAAGARACPRERRRAVQRPLGRRRRPAAARRGRRRLRRLRRVRGGAAQRSRLHVRPRASASRSSTSPSPPSRSPSTTLARRTRTPRSRRTSARWRRISSASECSLNSNTIYSTRGSVDRQACLNFQFIRPNL